MVRFTSKLCRADLQVGRRRPVNPGPGSFRFWYDVPTCGGIACERKQVLGFKLWIGINVKSYDVAINVTQT
jgi:hypothetical protein